MTRPLTAAELQLHPEYPHVHWNMTADKKEKINVAAGRGGPFKIAYELHGHGPRHIIASTQSLSLCCRLTFVVGHGPWWLHEDLAETDQGFRTYTSRQVYLLDV